MSTIVTDVVVSESTTRDRRQLQQARGAVPDVTNVDLGKVSLVYNQSKTIAFTKFIYLYFPKSTLITFTSGLNSVQITVVGPVVLPCEGSIQVAHTTEAQTDPIVFDYVKA